MTEFRWKSDKEKHDLELEIRQRVIRELQAECKNCPKLAKHNLTKTKKRSDKK